MQHRSSIRTRNPHRFDTSLALLVVAIALFGAACSSSKGTSVASLPGQHGSTAGNGNDSQAQSDQSFVDYARCLRGHGVNEPDPFHRPGHAGLSIDIPTPGPGTRAALAACSHFIHSVDQKKATGAQVLNASSLAARVSYARCMRSHDISMPDPGADGQLNLGPVSGLTSDFGRYSSQFRAADRACRHLLPAGVHDDGTGP